MHLGIFAFPRHKNEIFFSWTGLHDQLPSLLESIQKQHPNVCFQFTTGVNIRFMDAHIENRRGSLYSQVHHNPDSSRYLLPYVTGHSVSNHSDWLRFALVRAVCYCTSVEDFNRERIYLELCFLVNGYSLLFVETRVGHFFAYFNMSDVRYSLDKTRYRQFRHQVFEWIDRHHRLSEDMQKFDDHGRLIRFTYLYEFGPRSQFDRELHRLWSNYFANHPILSGEQSKLVLTTKHYHSLNAVLTRQKPTSLL